MDFSLFSKSYDFRGVFGRDFSTEDFKVLGYAISQTFPGKKFALGWDARVSSPELAQAFEAWVLAGGKDIVRLGLVSTDMLQYATVGYADVDVGFMITASHNPKEYNGLKACLKNAEPANLKEWGPKIADFLDSRAIASTHAPSPGHAEVRDISDLWIEHVASFATGDFRWLRVVADAGNGVAGAFLEKLAARLGFELIGMYLEPDGNFPHHHPSPAESKNLVDLIEKVREVRADIGVAFDGDADRAVACDETGVAVPASAMMCAITEAVLSEKPGASIVYNTPSSNAVPELITRLGGRALKAKVGNVYTKEMMRNDPSIEFGGEHSSHYFFKKNANADSGIIAFVYFVSGMLKKKKKASEIRKEYLKYPAIEETNFSVTNVSDVVEKLEKAYPHAEKDRFDGLTLRMPEFWINVRASSNEPLVRLNLEAVNESLLHQEFERISRIFAR